MSRRLYKSWTVLTSSQTSEADRCVDVFSRPEGTFGFEEFRRELPSVRCRGWPPFPSSREMLVRPHNRPLQPAALTRGREASVGCAAAERLVG
jgi:hypothetical protein